jgi:dipeptidase E
MLIEASKKGAVLCGTSAGSICWYESGHSDSMSFYNPKDWKYIIVKGIGLLKWIHCPHNNSHTLGKSRKEEFQSKIKENGGFGIAIEDSCAIEYVDDKFRVLKAKPEAKAYRVYKKHGEILQEEIVTGDKFIPTKELYKI